MFHLIYKKSHLHLKALVALIALSLFFTSCQGSMEDISSLEASKGSATSGENIDSPATPNPGDEPDPGNPGSNPGDGSGDGSNAGGGSGNSLPPASPVIEILNVNSSYFRGGITQDLIFRITSRVGAVSKVEYVVACPTPTAVPEFTILTGGASNTPSAVTIQDGVVSVGAGEDTTVSWNTPNLADVRCRKVDNSFEQADNRFKIRITSVGESNLTSSAESQEFKIDSEAPILANNGISCIGGGCVVGGVSSLQVSGVYDLVTPVADMCLKMDDPAPPDVNDICWTPLSSMGIAVPTLTPANFEFNYFLGFLPFTMTGYFWTKDAAGNISSLSNAGTGTNARDSLSISTSGTTRYVNDYTALSATSTGLYHHSSTGEFLTMSDANVPGVKHYLESSASFTTTVPANDSVNLAPNGEMFVRSESGISRFDTKILDDNPGATIKASFIPNTGSFTEGTLGVAAFNHVKRHTIDAKGVHWFLDDGKIAYYDPSEASPQLTYVAGGGTSETTELLADPKELKINDSADIDAYGVFTVLPNQWVVFSSDDPTLPVSSPVDRFKLRVYKHNSDPSKRSVSTIFISGSTAQGSTDALVPYSRLAVSYDPVRNNIANITGRFCATSFVDGIVDHCDSAKLIKFYISTNTSPEYMGSVNRDSFLTFQYGQDTLFMMDATKGTVSKYDASSFQKIVGANSAGTSYCTNFTPSTSCQLRVRDFKPIMNGNDQVLIMDQNYLRIVELGQVFTIFSAVP
ncbi:hypothetical protein [Pseudobdellovibrio sp. HCB154]|uniref:hypothetical protein n=1 Tax=Pseudobdellovibrio sp. HCB154 TaxID=3386277 RepID=UPI0039170BD2